MLDWAQKYDLTILIDIHGIKDSQNGFDNSGQSLGFEWTSVLNTEPKGLVTFEHWPIRTANWMVSLLCDPLHPQFNHGVNECLTQLYDMLFSGNVQSLHSQLYRY